MSRKTLKGIDVKNFEAGSQRSVTNTTSCSFFKKEGEKHEEKLSFHFFLQNNEYGAIFSIFCDCTFIPKTVCNLLINKIDLQIGHTYVPRAYFKLGR